MSTTVFGNANREVQFSNGPGTSQISQKKKKKKKGCRFTVTLYTTISFEKEESPTYNKLIPIREKNK